MLDIAAPTPLASDPIGAPADVGAASSIMTSAKLGVAAPAALSLLASPAAAIAPW